MKNIYQYSVAASLSCFMLIVPLLTQAGIPPISLPASTIKPPVVKWTIKNPFEQKAFIENKGQYGIKNKINASDILFGAQLDDLNYYFTNNSIWIGHIVKVKRTEKEIEQLKQKWGEKSGSKEKEDDNEEKELNYKNVEEFHEMIFTGANPEAQITTGSEVSWYYSCTLSNNEPVKARAWKKLTYINLYPGIDMEFYFPEDKKGFKYDFIVHPGADISQIKINYPQDEKINLTGENNIVIQSRYGQFVDHAPIAMTQGSEKAVDCTFKLNNGAVQFNMGDYDKTELLTIDPWTIVPTFYYSPYGNNAAVVDWDDAGNSYVLRGPGGGTGPGELLKYDSTGKLIWSYIFLEFISNGEASDFAVDRKLGSVYICQSFTGGGSEAIKLNSSGSRINLYPGNPYSDEFWRIGYSPATSTVIICGAGTAQNQGEVFHLDTNLVSFTAVDAFNLLAGNGTCAFFDCWGLALDKLGNCYVAEAGHYQQPLFANNPIVKCPLPTLTPTLWKVSSGYKFDEGVGTYDNFGQGFNGMACSCTNLFTYDSYVLEKWSLDSGKLQASLTINGPSQVDPAWGGITTDDFGNVFLGSNDSLKQYTHDLQLANTIGLPGTIFDVKISDKNIVFVCGNGFLSAIDANSLPTYGLIPKVKAHVINPSSCVYPYGTAIVDSPAGLPSPSISWNTTPEQFGYSAINVVPGTYIVTIDYGCYGNIYDTVTIKKTGSEQFDTIPACTGQPVRLTGVLGENNYVWTPSTGLSSTSGESVTANLSANTTYSVISTFNGCYDTAQINVSVKKTPVVTINPPSTSICGGTGTNTFTASGAPYYQWSPSTGLNESTGAVVTAEPSITTTYTVTGIDTISGCSSSISITVYVGDQPKASFTSVSPVQCEPQTLQFSNTSVGGNNYLWKFGDGSTDTVINPSHTYSKPGNYTITLVVSSVSGCLDSLSVNQVVVLGSDVAYIPSAFTPNGNSNNYFFPDVVCSDAIGYEFRVYNRWGQMLYESNEQNQGWDGKYNGVLQPMDTYVYYLKLTCNGCNVFNKGNVTLLK